MRAAIRIDGNMYTGWSHSDAIMEAPHGLDMDTREEGFLTDEGDFLNRTEAMTYARSRGLVPADTNSVSLQSWMLH